MSFRARIALVSAVAVALAVVIASVVVYFVVRGQLFSSLDESLRETAHEPGRALFAPGPPSRELGYVQVVFRDGTCTAGPERACALPVTPGAQNVAAGERKGYYSEATASDADHTRLRIYTFPVTFPVPGTGLVPAAVQVARPLTEVDHSLSRIRWYLIIIAVGGIAVAAGLGLLVSRTALAPVRRLTGATERVAETGDLSERIDVSGEDELSRLAGSFNTMLGALDDSRRVQRQLVEDASHELRTPLTSLRTNIEVLASERALPPEDRERLLSDVVEQLQEMSLLVGDLLEVARGEQHGVEPQDVRLDLVAADALERVQRNRPGVTFKPELEESLVRGVPATIERAVGNLLDNAAKWSPTGGEVDLAVKDGTVVVRDHGPGIADEDLPHVFERFYRAKSARGMPGSGLGLAIVRQVAEAHGGGVELARANGGGTVATLTFPRDGS
jgi:two-component system, OmpR family, sensor histidine kinase MprB